MCGICGHSPGADAEMAWFSALGNESVLAAPMLPNCYMYLVHGNLLSLDRRNATLQIFNCIVLEMKSGI